jgi:rhamnulokinase
VGISAHESITALAFDLGASSGRAILGSLSNGRLDVQEIHRFRNDPLHTRDGLRWNAPALRAALEAALAAAPRLDSVGVDTWGVDYGLIGADGELLANPHHYRDSRTDGVMESLTAKIGKERIYGITGIQFMQINTLYQLRAAVLNDLESLASAKAMLTMPDLLNYWLTGVIANEYTNATTTQMIDCRTRQWSPDLLCEAGIPSHLPQRIIEPGTVLGPLKSCARTLVVAPACHDTGSAVAAVEASGTAAFLSSGTWSLLGTEVRTPVVSAEAMRLNFTNEGGVDGTVRLLKNITGMWLLESCINEWKQAGRMFTYDELISASRDAKPFVSLIDPDDALFLHPASMTAAIDQYCAKTHQPTPDSPGAYVRAILEGLALKYRVVLEQLESLTGTTFIEIRVIGGGSHNTLLNQFTADATGRRVIAGPKEATALGNLIVQLAGIGALGSIQEGRALIARCFEPRTYEPAGDWSAPYQRLLTYL